MSTMTKCPNCSKILKLKSEAVFGKKTACPQCREPFTVKPFKKKKAKPVVEEPEDEYEDTYGDYDDTAYDDDGGADQYDDYEAAPKRSASSKSGSSKKKSKKKKKAAGLPPWLKYVAFGLAGVLVLGGVVVTAVGGGGSNVMVLAWLPEDADLFVKVEPDELWNAPMLASVRDNETVKQMLELAAQQNPANIGLEDVDSVTMAGIDMADTYQQQVSFLGNQVGAPSNAKKTNAKMVGVVRLKKDITAADLGDDADSRKKDHGGKTYYTAPGNQAVYLADARTMIIGQEDQVKLAIDRGPAEPRVSWIDFINPRHQVLFVVAPPKILDAESRAAVDSSASGDSQQKFQQSLNEKTKAFSFGLSLTSNIEMELQMQCFSSSDAESLKTELDTALIDMKTKFEASTGALSEQFADFVAIGKEAIDSLNAQNSGDEITVAATIPGRITTAVQDAITNDPTTSMVLQLMMQQFNQGASPPAGIGGANAESLNPTAGVDPAQAGQPSNVNPEDFEAGVRQDQQNTLDTLNGVRGQIKKTTGALQDAVPGGK
ncbi:MAG: hypothetical protein ACKVHE_34425 [Planctomycetales bacterium]